MKTSVICYDKLSKGEFCENKNEKDKLHNNDKNTVDFLKHTVEEMSVIIQKQLFFQKN